MEHSVTISEATKGDVLPALEILLGSYLGEEYFSREVAEPILRRLRIRRSSSSQKIRSGRSSASIGSSWTAPSSPSRICTSSPSAGTCAAPASAPGSSRTRRSGSSIRRATPSSRRPSCCSARRTERQRAFTRRRAMSASGPSRASSSRGWTNT
jgi:hypothetical protein